MKIERRSTNWNHERQKTVCPKLEVIRFFFVTHRSLSLGRQKETTLGSPVATRAYFRMYPLIFVRQLLVGECPTTSRILPHLVHDEHELEHLLHAPTPE